MRDSVCRADSDHNIEVDAWPVNLVAMRLKELRSIAGAGFALLLWIGLILFVLSGKPVNGRAIQSASQLSATEWLILLFAVSVTAVIWRDAIRTLRDAPSRFRQIKGGLVRRWNIEFPVAAGDGPWVVTGFGDGVPGRRLVVKLMRGTWTIGRQRSFRVAPEAPSPFACILANDQQVAAAKSDSESSWPGQRAVYTQPQPCSIRVTTELPKSRNARPDGTWRLQLELTGDPEPPETLLVRLSSLAHRDL